MLLAGLASQTIITAESAPAIEAVFKKVGGFIVKDHGNADFTVCITADQKTALKDADVILELCI